jgi:tetratricopeptide (TPR) repeat protein
MAAIFMTILLSLLPKDMKKSIMPPPKPPVETPSETPASKEEPPKIKVAKEQQKSPELLKMEEGRAALKAERYEEAVSIFRNLLVTNPNMIKTLSVSYSEALQKLASESMKTDPEKAQELLVKALELQPNSVKANFQLGLLFVKQKDYAKAIEAYEKVTSLSPDFPDAFFNLGYIYAKMKDYKKAETMYRRVVKISPPFVDEALFNLAIVQVKQGKRDLCIKNLKRALQINPKNEPARKTLERLTGKKGKKP